MNWPESSTPNASNNMVIRQYAPHRITGELLNVRLNDCGLYSIHASMTNANIMANDRCIIVRGSIYNPVQGVNIRAMN